MHSLLWNIHQTLSNSYVHFGTLHCSGFLACISTNTVEETAFPIVQKGWIHSDCKDGPVKAFSPLGLAAGIPSALIVAGVISISPIPALPGVLHNRCVLSGRFL